VVLLSSPLPGQPLTNSSNPSVDDDFVKDMTAILSLADAAHSQSKMERQLPYELRAVEVGLATAVRAWEMETITLEHKTRPTLRALLQKVCRGAIYKACNEPDATADLLTCAQGRPWICLGCCFRLLPDGMLIFCVLAGLLSMRLPCRCPGRSWAGYAAARAPIASSSAASASSSG
jgi:hypothetical protein